MARATYLIDHFLLTDVRGDLFLGCEAGEHLERDLMSAQRTVEVVAPSICSQQHQQLAQLAKRGVHVTYASVMPSTNQDAISIGSNLMNVKLASYDDKVQAYNLNHRKSKLFKGWKRFFNVIWILLLLITLVTLLALVCSLVPAEAMAFAKQSGFALPFDIDNLIVVLSQNRDSCIKVTATATGMLIGAFILSRVFKGIAKKAKKTAENYYPDLYRWEYTTNVDFVLFPNAEQRRLAYSMDQNETFPIMNIRLFIIDGVVAYLGSIDFTTQSLENNLESVMRIMDSHTIQRLQSYVRTLMSVNHYTVISSATYAEYYINNYQMSLYSYPEGVVPAPGLWAIYDKTLDVQRIAKEYYEEGFAQGLSASQSFPVVSEINDFLQNTENL
ncbi:MAG: hypothetical protein GX562_01925 [Coriobacteriaceae bacterium]|nr:hypothetical protein [Coriobacteriaceae bacterium]